MRFRRRAAAAAPAPTAAFGYKTAWLAFSGSDPAEVATLLGLADVRPADAGPAVEAASGDSRDVVVLPPLRGADGDWVLATGFVLHEVPDLDALSRATGGEVQYYATHRVVEAHQWARSVDGSTQRHFSSIGERYEVDRWFGRPDASELELGLPNVEKPGEADVDIVMEVVDEETVLAVASRWSLDPRELDVIPGPALLGRLPAH